VVPPNALAGNPDEGPEDDIPPNLDSGSPPLRSYTARFCGSVPKMLSDLYGQRRTKYEPERTWNALETTETELTSRKQSN